LFQFFLIHFAFPNLSEMSSSQQTFWRNRTRELNLILLADIWVGVFSGFARNKWKRLVIPAPFHSASASKSLYFDAVF
jgi:hypothetical protein